MVVVWVEVVVVVIMNGSLSKVYVLISILDTSNDSGIKSSVEIRETFLISLLISSVSLTFVMSRIDKKVNWKKIITLPFLQ